MSSSLSGWEIQSPRTVRVVVRTIAVPVVAASLAILIVIHNLGILLGIVAGLGLGAVSMWGMSHALSWEGARKLRALPSGTLFVARGGVRLQQIRDQPRFDPITTGRGGKYVSGWVSIDRDGIALAPMGTGSFLPSRRRPSTSPPATISWDEVIRLRAEMTPAKANVGWLNVELQDGSHVRVGVAGYRRMVKALNEVIQTRG